MRKPCLEYLMKAAAKRGRGSGGNIPAHRADLAQMTREMEFLLDTGDKEPLYCFGRFVKESACFALIEEGFRELLPEMKLYAADEDFGQNTSDAPACQKRGCDCGPVCPGCERHILQRF